MADWLGLTIDVDVNKRDVETSCPLFVCDWTKMICPSFPHQASRPTQTDFARPRKREKKKNNLQIMTNNGTHHTRCHSLTQLKAMRSSVP